MGGGFQPGRAVGSRSEASPRAGAGGGCRQFGDGCSTIAAHSARRHGRPGGLGDIDTCKQVGFSGFLSIEQDKYDEDMKQVCERYLALMREYIG